MSEPFLGQITLFPYSFAPLGWADCAGQLMSTSQSAALFSLLKNTFGGDGRSTFGLPNLQGRVCVGQGTGPGLSPYTIGEDGGAETVTLQPGGSGKHTHSLNATTARGTGNAPAGNLLATGQTGEGRDANTASIYNAALPTTPLAAKSIAPAGGSAGGTSPHNNLQPFLVLRYCIALQGTFPTRS
jgi:microcystin-dependent protein